MLTGAALDDRHRELRGRALSWYAGRKRLGHGRKLTVRLPAGRPVLRLVARDPSGRRGVARLRVRVRRPALKTGPGRLPALPPPRREPADGADRRVGTSDPARRRPPLPHRPAHAASRPAATQAPHGAGRCASGPCSAHAAAVTSWGRSSSRAAEVTVRRAGARGRPAAPGRSLEAATEERGVRLAVVGRGRAGRGRAGCAACRAGPCGPASAISTTSANISSMLSAGVQVTRTRTSSSPAFANPWRTPGSISRTSPAVAVTWRRPTRKRIVPPSISKRSVWIGCTCGIGTAPPGRSASSKVRRSPSVEAAVSMKVKRSPVTGFSSVVPGVIMRSSVSPPRVDVYDHSAAILARSSSELGRSVVFGAMDVPDMHRRTRSARPCTTCG